MKKRLEISRTTVKVLRVRTDVRTGLAAVNPSFTCDPNGANVDSLALASPATPKPAQ